jgi:hypothetical protein
MEVYRYKTFRGYYKYTVFINEKHGGQCCSPRCNRYTYSYQYGGYYDNCYKCTMHHVRSGFIDIPSDISEIVGSSQIPFLKIPNELRNRLKFEKAYIFPHDFYDVTVGKTREAINTFSLICIRYYSSLINKDIRLKICKLLWNHKSYWV